MERALLARTGVVDDPFALAMLEPPMRATYEVARRWPRRIPTLPVTLAGLAARVLWHDERVSEALEAGIRQVAIIGAVVDSRAWRLAADGVRFFELDHPSTQREKVRRAPGPGPTYVAADLDVDSAAEVLQRCGLDRTQPAMFVVEGVTMYLPGEAVQRQFTELAATSAAGSRLTTDFYPPEGGGKGADQRQHRMQRLARAGSGERLRLLVNRAEAVELVETSGWRVDDARGVRDAAKALVPTGSGLPVDAVNDQKSLVSATRTIDCHLG